MEDLMLHLYKIAVLVIMIFCSGLIYGNDFLEIPLSARVTGMGGAFSSVEGDVNSMFCNPAGLHSTAGLQVSASYLNLWEGLNFNALAVSKDFLGGTAGVGIGYLFFPPIGITDDWGNETESLDFSNMVVDLGYSRLIFHHPRFYIAGGAILKTAGMVMKSSSLKQQNMEWGCDTGLLFHVDCEPQNIKNIEVLKNIFFFRKGFNVGVVAQNLDLNRKSGYTLPFIMKAGVSTEFYKNLLLSFDINKYQDVGLRYNAGAEFSFLNIISIRAGLPISYDMYSFMSGLGLKLKVRNILASFDYALSVYQNHSLNHNFTLTMKMDDGSMNTR